MSVAIARGYLAAMRRPGHAVAGLAGLALCLAAAGAAAQALVSTGQSFVTARLLPGAPGEGGERVAGLSLTLADGWKTYWRSPGEAGVPPVFDWSASRNLRAAEVLWPRPELFESFGFRTAGYAHGVVLPLRLVAQDPSRPIELRLSADLGVCSDLCVLEKIEVARTIAPGESGGAGPVARALDAVPDDAAASGLTAAECRITGAGDERRLEARLTFARPLTAPAVLVEGPENVAIGATETRHDGGGEIGVSAAMLLPDGGAWIDRSKLRLTVLDDGFAADLQGCSAPE